MYFCFNWTLTVTDRDAGSISDVFQLAFYLISSWSVILRSLSSSQATIRTVTTFPRSELALSSATSSASRKRSWPGPTQPLLPSWSADFCATPTCFCTTGQKCRLRSQTTGHPSSIWAQGRRVPQQKLNRLLCTLLHPDSRNWNGCLELHQRWKLSSDVWI